MRLEIYIETEMDDLAYSISRQCDDDEAVEFVMVLDRFMEDWGFTIALANRLSEVIKQSDEAVFENDKWRLKSDQAL